MPIHAVVPIYLAHWNTMIMIKLWGLRTVPGHLLALFG
jgi:hypothetical protein